VGGKCFKRKIKKLSSGGKKAWERGEEKIKCKKN
jgi:hypothetical protein